VTVQTWVPMRRELMSLESGWLLLIAALVSVLVLWLQVFLLFLNSLTFSSISVQFSRRL